MACCGRICNIEVDNGDAFEGYISQISQEGERIDVTKFGDGIDGSWLVDCKVTGSIMIQSYDDPGASVGDENALSANVCSHLYTCDATVQSKTVDFDAKGVPYWTTTWAVTSAISGF